MTHAEDPSDDLDDNYSHLLDRSERLTVSEKELKLANKILDLAEDAIMKAKASIPHDPQRAIEFLESVITRIKERK